MSNDHQAKIIAAAQAELKIEMQLNNAEYKTKYGVSPYSPESIKPNYHYCAYEVISRPWSWQCSRKKGHGPNLSYCKQHAKILEAKQ